MTGDDRQALAGEYVLGILDEAGLARCEALIDRDPAFAAAVAAWRAHLGELDLTAAPLVPADGLWQRIEASLDAGTASRAAASPSGWRRLARLWDSLPVWRGIGLGAACAALLLAVALGAQMRQAGQTMQAAPVLVAVLLSEQNSPAAIVNAYGDGRAELVPLTAMQAPAGRSLQVWTLWDRARGPVSVGLLDALRSLDLMVDGLPGTAPDQLFEITLEPAGGSPTGRPTGPILMKGTASRAL